MKISKSIKIKEKLEIHIKYYFEIPTMLVSSLKKKYDIDIPRYTIWRVALDDLCKGRWDYTFTSPAYRNLDLSELQIVTKKFTEYFKDPSLLVVDMKRSNSYRNSDRIGVDLIEKLRLKTKK